MEQQYKREVAMRIFSDEFATAETVEKEEGEYAPQYTRLNTGHLINRVFICGALIEKEDVGNDSEYWKCVISDPKGTFRAYIGEYQPNALASIDKIEVPSFVSVVAKIKYNEYNDKVFFHLAPEYITVVDEVTYDRWCAERCRRGG